MTRQQTNLNKIIIVILLIFLSFLILFNNVNAITFENVKVVKNEQEILEDVVIYNYQVINSNYGTNSKLDRNVFSYTIPKASSKVKLATWTYNDKLGYSAKNLMTIAEDYEKNHPGWMVIGGINAEGYCTSNDGYSQYELTNALVQDGDVIRKDVSSEETKELIAIDDDRSYTVKRVPEVSSNPFLYVYESQFGSNVLKHLEIKNINSCPDGNEIGLFIPSFKGSVDLSGYNVYEFDTSLYRISTNFPNGPTGTLTGTNLGVFVKGSLVNINKVSSLTSISRNKFYLVSKDDSLNSVLSIGTNVKCQYDYLDEFGKVDTVIGYWFKYIDKGVICDADYQVYLEPEKHYSTKYGSHAYWYSTNKERAGIGFKENGDVVIMAAHTGKGGPTQYEVGQYLKMMDCYDAYQFDGGGSVTFIKRNENGGFDMLNEPGDGSPRSILAGLFIVVQKPDIEINVSNLTSNSFNLNYNVINSNGYNTDTLYIRMKNVDKKPILFTESLKYEDLDSNTEYTYELYTMEDGIIKSSNIKGSIKTLKKEPVIDKITIKFENNCYTYAITMSDPDNSLDKIMISVNESDFELLKNQKSSEYIDIDCFTNIKIKYIYKLSENTNYITKELKVKDFSFNTIVILEHSLFIANNKLNDVLN